MCRTVVKSIIKRKKIKSSEKSLFICIVHYEVYNVNVCQFSYNLRGIMSNRASQGDHNMGKSILIRHVHVWDKIILVFTGVIRIRRGVPVSA